MSLIFSGEQGSMGFVFVIVLAELFAGNVVNDFDDFSVLICSTASRNFLNTGYTKICEKPLYSRSKYFTAVWYVEYGDKYFY